MTQIREVAQRIGICAAIFAGGIGVGRSTGGEGESRPSLSGGSILLDDTSLSALLPNTFIMDKFGNPIKIMQDGDVLVAQTVSDVSSAEVGDGMGGVVEEVESLCDGQKSAILLDRKTTGLVSATASIEVFASDCLDKVQHAFPQP